MQFTASSLNLSAFDLDPFRDADPEHIMEYCESVETEVTNLYQELTEGTNKQNVFQKLWSYAMKLLKLIQRGLNKVISFIKRIFGKKKITKTADQIAEESGLTATSTVSSSSAFSSKSALNEPISGSKSVSSEPIKVVKVSLPKNPESTMDIPDTISIMYKKIALDIKQDVSDSDNEISFNLRILSEGRYRTDLATVRGHESTAGSVSEASVIYMISLAKDHEYMQQVVNISKAIMNKDFDDPSMRLFIDKKWNKYIKMDLEQSLTHREIIEIQARMNEITNNLSKINIAEYNINLNDHFIDTFNRFVGWISNIQYSINTLTALMGSVLQIDAKYIGSVKNQDQLAKFVEMMIKNGIPPKYVAYNCFLSADKSISGNDPKQSEWNPIWGQSRMVLFPSNDPNHVVKVAISGEGIRSNRFESQLFDRFKKIGPEATKVLASVDKITPDGCISTVERAPKDKNMSSNTKNQLINNASQIISNHNIKLGIHDIHAGNVGKRVSDGSYCLIDYGELHLVS